MHASRMPRSRVVIKASEQEPTPSESKSIKVQQKVLDELKKGGWDENRAKEALKTW
jgi:hypothetical protein